MCGISGVVSSIDRRADIEACRHVLAHRGPDSLGMTHHRIGEAFVSVVHNRLSVIDLTDDANQPFFNADKSAYLVYNGEIYNYLELREELAKAGVVFRTASDTEVLLQGLLHWGIEACLSRLNGMWAFAFCDLKNARFFFARDRFGIKPFYYTIDESGFSFGSEIKFILAIAKRKFRLDGQTTARYITQHLLETDPQRTFFEGISKLPAGHYAELDLRSRKPELKLTRYYRAAAGSGQWPMQEAKERLQYLLRDSIALQLRSDVKVGVLLSGGIESSAIACIAQRHTRDKSDSDISLLSLTSKGSPFDEGPYVEKVERHIGATAERIDIGRDAVKFLDLLSEVQWFNDEPITSFSAVAYYQMMARARELGITVLLTGQGADEIFCGYKKYLGFYLQSLLREGNVSGFGKEVAKFAINGAFVYDVHWAEMKRYVSPGANLRILGPALRGYEPLALTLKSRSLIDRQVFDIEHTSIPALLHYEDRLSMAFSREIRVPFLDHRIVEFALSCRDEHRIGAGWTKRVLREAVADVIPHQIAWRRDKNGFAVPQIEWMKTALRSHIERLFNGDCLMYDMRLVEKSELLSLYQSYCHAFFDSVSYKRIFSALALEVWLRRYSEHIA